MMKYMATADTDIGSRREANQDSLLIRHSETPEGEVLLCAVCDGLGGLSRGELASATVVRAFSDWFDREMTGKEKLPDLQDIAGRWEKLLRSLNRAIRRYGEKEQIRLGTTFSGMLFAGGRYLICHVGDSRIYHIGEQAVLLTEDQTVTAREIKKGRMSAEQAKRDAGNSILLQCVGASASVKPQTIIRKAKPGVYLLCSDGMYHETSGNEIREILCPETMEDRRKMHSGARRLIELAEARGETDNISAVVVRVQGGSGKRAGRRRG